MAIVDEFAAGAAQKFVPFFLTPVAFSSLGLFGLGRHDNGWLAYVVMEQYD
jgi:hypothetical protein